MNINDGGDKHMASDNEETNGKVTMAVLGARMDIVIKRQERIENKLDEALGQITRHDERIKGLSARTMVTDGLNLIAALIAASLFGKN